MRVFVFLITFFICQFSWAQQSPYSQKWTEIDTLELRGQVASAIKIVDTIRASAKNTRSIDYVKASIFRWKFLKITTENAENTIIQEVTKDYTEAYGIEKALFATIKAKLLREYYNTNRYRANERSTGKEKTKDITSWSNLELVQEVLKSYEQALKDKEALLQTPAKDVNDLLYTALVTRDYKPTLYDLIAQEALQFYNHSFYGLDRPATLFELDHPVIFGDSEAFRAWDFKSEDTLVSKFNAVKLLQEIEEVHKNDKEPGAYVFAQLQRLQYARRHYTKSGKEALYEEALIALLSAKQPGSQKHKNHPIYSLLQYALASYYVDQAPYSFEKNKEANKLTYYAKAEAICEMILVEYPNSEAAAKATRLLKEIRQAFLALKTKKHTLPGVENRLFASYRNLDSLRVRILRLPAHLAMTEEYNLRSGILELAQSKDPTVVVEDKSYALPKATDRNHHTAEFLLPPLEHGYYIVFIDNTRLEDSQSYAFARVEVSDFGHTKTEYNDKLVYQWYDRISGQPMRDLKIETTGGSAAIKSSGFTNELGEYIMNKPSHSKNHRDRRMRVTAIHKGDTLHFQDYVYENYRSTNDNKNTTKAKTEIFLDRAIYRPGQTMYFKGILLQELDKKSEVVPNEKVTLLIRDVNYEEIFKKEFTSNEYGSFSGEFQLPENVLTGQFSISTIRGKEKSNFWKTLDTYNVGNKAFRVEAYKRPTFEITFDEVTQAYQPNDSITITGNAKAFLGSNITEASGTYAIKRSKFNRYWYYWRNRDEERQLDAGTLKTDDKGNFEIRFKADFEDQSEDAIFQFTAEVKITDLNGETRTGSLDIKVSKNNLYTLLTDPKQVTGGSKITLEIANKNLSDVLVPCENTLRIFKMQAPDKVLFERLWETPEHQEISEAAFVKAFPQEPYATDSVPSARGKKVYEGTFSKESEYEVTIPTDQSWEAGEYVIEHIAQGKNNSQAITLQSFTILQPKNTYLPADQLFSYEQLNENPKKDGFVKLRLKTSLKNLPVFSEGFYNGQRFFAEKWDVNGNETITIDLDASYEKEAVIRLKYAQYDRFFFEDIAVDLSEPLEFLQIETESFRSKLYPDSKEKWSFKITNEKGKKAQAEVLASMYDMSLDNFAKSYWSQDIAFKQYNYQGVPRLENYEDYIANFQVRLKETGSSRHVSSFDRFNYFGLSFDRYNGMYQQYLRGLRDKQEGGLDEVIITAQGVKREKKALGYAVTTVENEEVEIGDDLMLNSLEPASIAEALVGAEGGQLIVSTKSGDKASAVNKVNFNNVKVRSDLKETAFFYPHLTTNKKGEIQFNFEAPQLLTRWKFRLLAHSKNLSTATEEKEVITQKDLSLVPNTPRFLREGDEVQLSAKIANLTSKAMQGFAQLQLFDAATMQPIDEALTNTQATQAFEIDANGNASIFWKLEIPVGTQAIAYRMLAKAGKFSDGEENILPVLPNRMLVTETAPFLLRAGQEKQVVMTHILENTSSSLEHQQFAFEYTANPSWYALQSLPYLMEFPHECAEQTFSRLYANSLSAKVLNSNPKIKEIFNKWKGDGVLTSALEKNEDLKNILIAETPWLRNAQSETERKKRLGLLFDLEKNAFAKAKALKKLQQIQNSDGGFPWFSGGNSSHYITRHIIAGFGHMERLGISIEANKMLENAIDYLDIELEDELAIFIKRGGEEEDFYKRRDHLHFLYARSFFEKEYPLLGKVKQIAAKTQASFNKDWLEKSIYEKGLLALINERRGNSNMAKTLLTGLKESAVQSEVNGMYWKENRSGWYWYQAPIETHALLIEAFDEVMNDQKTVEELKIWLLQQKRTGDWQTTKATAAATYALLMSGTQFIELDDSVRFTMKNPQSQQKVDAAPREAGTGYLKATWSSDEVSKDAAQVNIHNTGTTVGYGGMYWQYFEDLDKIEKGEEQILNLSKKLFVVNDQDATAALEEITSDTPLGLGQTVRVQLTIRTQSNMEFVHLKDMRASGLEPIDVLSKHQYQDGISYYQSTRDVATHFFFDVLPFGTYVIEYDMRVNNKGSFSNGISTIQSMYAPEFSGNTAGMRVKVE